MRRTLRLGLAALAFALATLPTTALAWPAEVDGGGANLRAGVWDSVIAVLPGGSSVEVVGNGYDGAGDLWHRVQTSGGTMGWLHSKLLGQPGASTSSAPNASVGTATWYGSYFHGRLMANGEVYNMYDPGIAASNIYPLGAWLRVTNQNNGRSVVVRVTDTGSFGGSTIVDLSLGAFSQLAAPDTGRIPVIVQYA